MGAARGDTLGRTEGAVSEAATTNELMVVTPRAQDMIRRFLAEEEDPSDKVLRVGVASGGCSGFSYEVLIDQRRPGDLGQAFEGFELVMDPRCLQFLQGTVLDYVDTVGHAGFSFENPNAKASCGCGTSFTP